MSSVSVKGFLQQHNRHYYTPKTRRCAAALLTQRGNANLPCVHRVNEQDQLTPLCSPPTKGSHSVRHHFIAQHDWLGRNLLWIQSSRNNQKYVWCIQWPLIYCSLEDALSIMWQSKAVYGLWLQQSVSIIFNQSFHPFLLSIVPTVHPFPFLLLTPVWF